MIIPTEGFTAREWTDRASGEIENHGGHLPRLGSDSDWPTWAYLVCELPFIYRQTPPNPRLYGSWIEWANDFNRAVRY